MSHFHASGLDLSWWDLICFCLFFLFLFFPSSCGNTDGDITDSVETFYGFVFVFFFNILVEPNFSLFSLFISAAKKNSSVLHNRTLSASAISVDEPARVGILLVFVGVVMKGGF